METTKYRVFRYSQQNPFHSPPGWLAWRNVNKLAGRQCITSEELKETDVYSSTETEEICEFCRTVWNNTVSNMTAKKERAI